MFKQVIIPIAFTLLHSLSLELRNSKLCSSGGGGVCIWLKLLTIYSTQRFLTHSDAQRKESEGEKEELIEPSLLWQKFSYLHAISITVVANIFVNNLPLEVKYDMQ
jgi:hypothetical protein